MADEPKRRRPRKRPETEQDERAFPFLVGEPEPAGQGRRIVIRYAVPGHPDRPPVVLLRLLYGADRAEDLRLGRLPGQVALLAPWADDQPVLELVQGAERDTVRFPPQGSGEVTFLFDPGIADHVRIEGWLPDAPSEAGMGPAPVVLPRAVTGTLALLQSLPAARIGVGATGRSMERMAQGIADRPMNAGLGSAPIYEEIAARYRVEQMLPPHLDRVDYQPPLYPFSDGQPEVLAEAAVYADARPGAAVPYPPSPAAPRPSLSPAGPPEAALRPGPPTAAPRQPTGPAWLPQPPGSPTPPPTQPQPAVVAGAAPAATAPPEISGAGRAGAAAGAPPAVQSTIPARQAAVPGVPQVQPTAGAAAISEGTPGLSGAAEIPAAPRRRASVMPAYASPIAAAQVAAEASPPRVGGGLPPATGGRPAQVGANVPGAAPQAGVQPAGAAPMAGVDQPGPATTPVPPATATPGATPPAAMQHAGAAAAEPGPVPTGAPSPVGDAVADAASPAQHLAPARHRVSLADPQRPAAAVRAPEPGGAPLDLPPSDAAAAIPARHRVSLQPARTSPAVPEAVPGIDSELPTRTILEAGARRRVSMAPVRSELQPPAPSTLIAGPNAAGAPIGSPVGLPGQLGLQAQAAPRITGAIPPGALERAAAPLPPTRWERGATIAGAIGWTITAAPVAAAVLPAVAQTGLSGVLEAFGRIGTGIGSGLSTLASPASAATAAPVTGSPAPGTPARLASLSPAPTQPAEPRLTGDVPASQPGDLDSPLVTVRTLHPTRRSAGVLGAGESPARITFGGASAVAGAAAGAEAGGMAAAFAQRLMDAHVLPAPLATPSVADRILGMAREFLGGTAAASPTAPATPGTGPLVPPSPFFRRKPGDPFGPLPGMVGPEWWTPGEPADALPPTAPGLDELLAPQPRAPQPAVPLVPTPQQPLQEAPSPTEPPYSVAAAGQPGAVRPVSLSPATGLSPEELQSGAWGAPARVFPAPPAPSAGVPGMAGSGGYPGQLGLGAQAAPNIVGYGQSGVPWSPSFPVSPTMPGFSPAPGAAPSGPQSARAGLIPGAPLAQSSPTGGVFSTVPGAEVPAQALPGDVRPAPSATLAAGPPGVSGGPGAPDLPGVFAPRASVQPLPRLAGAGPGSGPGWQFAAPRGLAGAASFAPGWEGPGSMPSGGFGAYSPAFPFAPAAGTMPPTGRPGSPAGMIPGVSSPAGAMGMMSGALTSLLQPGVLPNLVGGTLASPESIPLGLPAMPMAGAGATGRGSWTQPNWAPPFGPRPDMPATGGPHSPGIQPVHFALSGATPAPLTRTMLPTAGQWPAPLRSPAMLPQASFAAAGSPPGAPPASSGMAGGFTGSRPILPGPSVPSAASGPMISAPAITPGAAFPARAASVPMWQSPVPARATSPSLFGSPGAARPFLPGATAAQSPRAPAQAASFPWPSPASYATAPAPAEHAFPAPRRSSAVSPEMVIASVFRQMASQAESGIQLAEKGRSIGGTPSPAASGAPTGTITSIKSGNPGSGPSAMEMDQLARQVYRRVKQRLAIERERKGGF